jgi:hypothetical protein
MYIVVEQLVTEEGFCMRVYEQSGVSTTTHFSGEGPSPGAFSPALVLACEPMWLMQTCRSPAFLTGFVGEQSHLQASRKGKTAFVHTVCS